MKTLRTLPLLLTLAFGFGCAAESESVESSDDEVIASKTKKLTGATLYSEPVGDQMVAKSLLIRDPSYASDMYPDTATISIQRKEKGRWQDDLDVERLTLKGITSGLTFVALPEGMSTLTESIDQKLLGAPARIHLKLTQAEVRDPSIDIPFIKGSSLPEKVTTEFDTMSMREEYRVHGKLTHSVPTRAKATQVDSLDIMPTDKQAKQGGFFKGTIETLEDGKWTQRGGTVFSARIAGRQVIHVRINEKFSVGNSSRLVLWTDIESTGKEKLRAVPSTITFIL